MINLNEDPNNVNLYLKYTSDHTSWFKEEISRIDTEVDKPPR